MIGVVAGTRRVDACQSDMYVSRIFTILQPQSQDRRQISDDGLDSVVAGSCGCSGVGYTDFWWTFVVLEPTAACITPSDFRLDARKKSFCTEFLVPN